MVSRDLRSVYLVCHLGSYQGRNQMVMTLQAREPWLVYLTHRVTSGTMSIVSWVTTTCVLSQSTRLPGDLVLDSHSECYQRNMCMCCTVKKSFRYSRPQPGCHLANSPWTGIMTSYINKSIPAQGEFGKWHPGWGREYRKPFFKVYVYVIPGVTRISFSSPTEIQGNIMCRKCSWLRSNVFLICWVKCGWYGRIEICWTRCIAG